jgi:hypothetical protein
MKIIILTIAGLVAAFGVYCLIVSCHLFMQFRQWSKARLLDIEVDVSQPGEFSGQFAPKCPIAACYVLLLELPPSFSGDSDTKVLLEGLEAHLSVMDSHGSELPDLENPHVECKTSGNPIMLERLNRLPEEPHTLKLTITKGAKALSGTKQRLFIEYRLGFQTISLHISFLVAVVAISFGTGLTFYGLKLTKKRRAVI